MELGKNIIDYGKEHKAWGTAVAVGTTASVVGTAMEYTPWAKKGLEFVKEGASKAWTAFKSTEAVAEMGTGRWGQFAAAGKLLTLPVGSVAGAATATVAVPLVAAGGWAARTCINQKWGDDIV